MVKQMRILSVIGARPQFVKASIVSLRIKEHHALEEYIVHTGQHYDANMSDIFFDELRLPKPHVNLGIGGGEQGAQTGRMLEALERTMSEAKPDIVLVYGDTNSTMAGALAAVKLHIPIAHVESGLRSFNRLMPEEINRVVTDHISDILFAPTCLAVDNLTREGIDHKKIHLVGDVMYDVAMLFSKHADMHAKVYGDLELSGKDYVLATVHRAENTEDRGRLVGILEGLQTIGAHMAVIMPLHPRTRKKLLEYGIDIKRYSKIKVIDPIGYLDMMVLEKNAKLIATDSGGMQKEAYFYKVPCITMRHETEWSELVQCHANELVGADPTRIVNGFHSALGKTESIFEAKLYGEGDAAVSLVSRLSEVQAS
ncbi:MAG TPA: UDP-N-acetylglucosamine 2-epimerase (non-hydrolyzing) [Gammaproteobacteria bacterium]|nr:UDP-N-acetylglucosamine 2-epimerase (non-hydrolyzing) [Gammaproteobacteria bacterium]